MASAALVSSTEISADLLFLDLLVCLFSPLLIRKIELGGIVVLLPARLSLCGCFRGFSQGGSLEGQEQHMLLAGLLHASLGALRT